VTELGLLPLALIPLALVELAKTARWRTLFGPTAPGYYHFLESLVLAQAANALAPVRVGEAAGVGLLVARGGRAAPAIASLAGSKALDAIALAVIAVLTLGLALVGAAAWTVVGAGLVCAVMLMMAMRGDFVRHWLDGHPIGRRLHLGAMADVGDSLRSPRGAAVVALTTGVVWAAGLLANAVVLAATGAPITLDLAARMLVAGYLVALVPGGPPARLGVFEAGVAGALLSAGVPAGTALAAAVALHVCQLTNLGLLMGGALAGRRWLPSA
jgi:uncharacterized membrane protein YbhN (UPF0104 family)